MSETGYSVRKTVNLKLCFTEIAKSRDLNMSSNISHQRSNDLSLMSSERAAYAQENCPCFTHVHLLLNNPPKQRESDVIVRDVSVSREQINSRADVRPALSLGSV